MDQSNLLIGYNGSKSWTGDMPVSFKKGLSSLYPITHMCKGRRFHLANQHNPMFDRILVVRRWFKFKNGNVVVASSSWAVCDSVTGVVIARASRLKLIPRAFDLKKHTEYSLALHIWNNASKWVPADPGYSEDFLTLVATARMIV